MSPEKRASAAPRGGRESRPTTRPQRPGGTCRHCGGLGYSTSSPREYAAAAACACVVNCEECGGVGHHTDRDTDGYLEVRPCRCASVFDRVQRFNTACLPARYADKTLENYEHHGGNQNKLKYLLLNYRKNFEPGSRGVLLMGNPGTGKTHLLAALVSYLTLERGLHCRYIDFMTLLSELKEGYNQGKTESAIIGPLLDFQILAVDELGKGRSTEWESAILDELISRRYNTRRTTLFATNYGLEVGGANGAAAGKADSARALFSQVTLEDRVGPRIYSRLHDMCDFHVLLGPDYRVTCTKR